MRLVARAKGTAMTACKQCLFAIIPQSHTASDFCTLDQ